MRLHVEERGSGPRAAVLLHGSLGSAHSWWRVTDLLVERGYRVLALDLPGHGLSPRDPHATVERAADAVIETLAGQHVTVAMGHSLGGMVLAAAAPRLQPDLAVHVDAPFTTEPDPDADAAAYERARRRRTEAWLRATRPHCSERDCQVEALAAERFDPVTAAAVAASRGGWAPAAGSIVVRAEPSHYVDPALAAALQRSGVQVRSIPGAAHSVWYSHFDAFVDALPEVFTQPPADPRLDDDQRGDGDVELTGRAEGVAPAPAAPPLTATCLCYLIRGPRGGREVLLGVKNTGFGAGYVVGLGGHLDPGEDARQATVREVAEECGLIVDADDLTHVADVVFRFPAEPTWDQHVTVFTTETWRGELVASEEITPSWYPTDALPLDAMWDDAGYWLPALLAGRTLNAEITFDSDNRTVTRATSTPRSR